MNVKVFGKEKCAICESTKRKLNHFIEKWGCANEVVLQFIDMDTPDGMAEGLFSDVNDIPTTIITQGETTHGRWDGIVPPSQAVREIFTKCS